jgi:hypothetical protein
MRDAMPWSGLAAVAVCVSRAAIAALIKKLPIINFGRKSRRATGKVSGGCPQSKLA